MSQFECEFEPEVLAAVLQSGWPERAEPQLRAHVAACAICSDVAAIAGAIDESREEMRAAALIPDSAHVWWAAQLRARREAAEAAARPMTAAQVVAFICAAGLVIVYFRAATGWFESAFGRVASGMASFEVDGLFTSAIKLVTEHGALALAMAAVFFVLPAAAFFAMGRE